MNIGKIAMEGTIYSYIVPVGRIIAGFFVGMMLGIVGGWAGLTFNALVGYPWNANIHLTFYLAGIGLGAGLGAYLTWMNLGMRWYLVVLTVFLVIVAGMLGSVLGNLYWDFFTDASYMGARDTRVNVTHFGAAIGAIIVSSIFGLYYQLRTRS